MEYNIDEHHVRDLYANMNTLHEIEAKIRMKLAAVETNLNESFNLGSYFHSMVRLVLISLDCYQKSHKHCNPLIYLLKLINSVVIVYLQTKR